VDRKVGDTKEQCNLLWDAINDLKAIKDPDTPEEFWCSEQMWNIMEKRLWTVEHQICNYAKTGEGHGVAKDEDDSVRIERLEQ
jgi:hypothetical protein